MRFRLLGSLDVSFRDRAVSPQRPRQRALLAYLALSAGRPVTVDGLIDAMWDAGAPTTARAQIQADVSAIRQAFREAGAPNPLGTGRGVYRVTIDPAWVDVTEFDQGVAQARAASDAGDPLAASGLLRTALGLWRGPALADVSAPYVDAARAGLDEQRLAAYELVADADLLLGREAEVAVELAALVRVHPLRERLCARLMVALYRCGRQADALDVARWLRRHLADEYGLDPGPLVLRTEQMILRNDPDLDRPAGLPGRDGEPARQTVQAGAPAPPRPAQLPARVSEFVGRRDHIASLDALLPDDAAPSSTMVIAALAGAGGIGKTTLAVWWAHRVAHRFPDGQLFADLNGFAAGPPRRPLEVLGRFLAALGVPTDRIPVDEESASGLYRSTLAGRRVLVVLDNAATAEQVRPLLPGEPRCAVLVTSRDRLSGLVATHGARRLTLDVLREPEAVELLGRTAGAERVAAEPAAAADLARLCGYLPLALRIAGAQLSDLPGRELAGHVDSLVTGDALRSLAIGEDQRASVQASITASYVRLAPDEQRLFRLIGVIPGPHVTVPALAAVQGAPAAAESMVDRLAAVHLAEPAAGGRYTMHDLVRRYAADRFAEEDGDDEHRRLLAVLFAWYRESVDAAVDLLRPAIVRLPRERAAGAPPPAAFPDAERALAWLDAERPNLTAAVGAAVGARLPAAAWLLVDALRGYLFIRPSVDWLEVARTGLAAAEAEGDALGQSAGRLCLAEAFWVHGRYDDAIEHYRQALALTTAAGWLHGHAAALNNLANVYTRSGHLPEAAGEYRRALTIRRRLRDPTGEALVLTNLGTVYHAMGEPRRAAEHQRRAAKLYRPAGIRHGEAMALTNLGSALHSMGRLAEAEIQLDRALSLARESGDTGVEVEALRTRAAICRDRGLLPEALRLIDAATGIARTGDRRFEPDLLNTTGTIHGRMGRFATALECHRRALTAAQQIGARGPAAEALAEVAVNHAILGRPTAARTIGLEAVALAHHAGHRLVEGRAHLALATAALAEGAPETAAAHARQAVAVHAPAGHRLGEARALALLAAALRPEGEAGADEHLRKARAIVASCGADPGILPALDGRFGRRMADI